MSKRKTEKETEEVEKVKEIKRIQYDKGRKRERK